MEVPNVKRKDYQLIGMEDDFLSLMEDTGETRDDLKCPGEENEVGNEIRAAIDNESEILVRLLLTVCVGYVSDHVQVTVLSAIGEECVIATKANTAVDK